VHGKACVGQQAIVCSAYDTAVTLRNANAPLDRNATGQAQRIEIHRRLQVLSVGRAKGLQIVFVIQSRGDAQLELFPHLQIGSKDPTVAPRIKATSPSE
jgi:hypothetical protein